MKINSLLFFTLNCIVLSGQTHLVGIKFGGSSSNVTGSNFITDGSSRKGVTGGLTYDCFFGNYFGAGFEIIWSPRGVYSEVETTDNTGNPNGGKATVAYNFDYVAMPVKFGLNCLLTFGRGNSSKAGGFVNLGLIPAHLVAAQTSIAVFDADGKETYRDAYTNTDEVNRFDIGGFTEIGLAVRFKERYLLFTSFLYQRSFTSVTNSNYFPKSEIKHKGMSLCVGLKYQLSKK